MFTSVKSVYREYATFYGREDRKTFFDFFFFQLIVVAVGLLVIFASFLAAGWTIGNSDTNGAMKGSTILAASFWGLFGFSVIGLLSLAQIATIVPWLALQARRLHDANFSAWWLLLHLLPLGALALLIMNCFKSVEGESDYQHEGEPKRTRSASHVPGQIDTSSDW